MALPPDSGTTDAAPVCVSCDWAAASGSTCRKLPGKVGDPPRCCASGRPSVAIVAPASTSWPVAVTPSCGAISGPEIVSGAWSSNASAPALNGPSAPIFATPA